ncbi:MAG: FGGY-family carbohydrate kinase [Coprothermobacterota bacterium]|nr:FGGY-family carbohydrate kinase [Coprothermobacterota bacterium]
MANQLIWAFDIGTTSLKAVAFRPDGSAVARAQAGYTLTFLPGDRIETNPSSWERAFRHCAAQLRTVPAAAKPEAIVVGGQGPTLVPLGKNGKAVDQAISWMDRRATDQSLEIRERTGLIVDSSFYMPKALWYSRHGFARGRVRWYTSCPDYIVGRLTGQLVTGLPAPGFQALVWQRQAMEAFGLAEAWPPFVPCGQVVGPVSKRGEAWSQVSQGIPVVVGPPDFVESWLGTATVKPGRAVDRGGTSQGINLCTDQPVRDTRLLTLPHIVPTLWNLSGIISTSGKALEWVRSLVGWERVPYQEVFRRAMAVPPGAEGLLFLPYLAGERAPLWRADARALFFGLHLRHTPAHLVRAVLEGVGYAMRHVLGCIQEHGLEVIQFRCTGRQATSIDWTRIKASITGIPCLLPGEVEAEPLGGAILGAVTLGWYADLVSAAEAMVCISQEIFPETSWETLYREGFLLYRSLAEDSLGHFSALTKYRQESNNAPPGDVVAYGS